MLAGSVPYGCVCGWSNVIRPDISGSWRCPDCGRMNIRVATTPAPVSPRVHPLRCGPGYCVVRGANLHCNHPAGSIACPAFSYMP